MPDAVPKLVADASPQATAEDIDRCYRHYLGREPDGGGRESWLARVDKGISLDEMRSHFVGSPEFHARTPKEKFAALKPLGKGRPMVFSLADVETVAAGLHVEGFREQIQGGTFRLPEGFDKTLDPDSPAYHEQQLALWRAITLRGGYDAAKDEDTPEISDLDAIHRPAFYALGDADLAGEHLIALGHILKLSGLKSGARALEYGAGFGQIALAFARLGVKVDTVDINPRFCTAVASLAPRYRVDLASHVQSFGFNPAGRPDAYDLVYFYESFHHCLEFKEVIPKLDELLKPGGKIIMAGEPVMAKPAALLPYPWGLRMDGENVTVMHRRGWMELGFEEGFLYSTFKQFGFKATKHVLPGLHYATAYVFERE
ncbi:class I SAM-dependent methyltransferase [Brevundimonas staleyi]|uniref:Class I SAM-dependent methyltransferase n=1 Tax=Brevundimonas staleyi TaxID=74326 RepID=A0ABW0FRF2_9CAUL